ncbi:MAG: glycosyltransferase family 4 protein [bacterium]
MHILLITDSYPPEIRSASHLMQELAESLLERRHKVSIVTCFPKYNLISNRKNSFRKLTIKDNITILRLKTLPHHKVNFIVRGLSQLTLPYIFLWNIKKYITQKIDVVIVYSPPLPLAIVGNKIKKLHGAEYILNVQDIFPQNAIDLGILRNKLLIKFFEILEKNSYKCADKIVVHSKGNKNFLIKKKDIPEDRVHIIHNWIDISPYINLQRTGELRKKYDIEDKFIFLFAGIIGPSQGLDLIINIAYKIKEISDICFLFIGDGTEKEKLIKKAKCFGLNNILFKTFISKEDYPKLLKNVDIGMACLTSKNKTPVVPGKILGYMAAGIPVAAFLNRESDGHTIIKEAACGYTADSDNEAKVLEIILQIYNERNRLKQYGENGFKYISANFEKNICIDQLEKLF